MGCAAIWDLSAMIIYHFAMHVDGAGFEDLGFMSLAGDGDALAFGKQVILDLMHGDRKYAGWIMDITEGERPVGRLPTPIE
jgi:hypothetical protein